MNQEPNLFEPTTVSTEAVGGHPLADRMRPCALEEFVGQEHLVGPGKPLRRMIEEDRLTSLILWGPPGSGKTTLARTRLRIFKRKAFLAELDVELGLWKQVALANSTEPPILLV